LSCWRENTVGEITPPSGSFVAVAAAMGFSCAIRTDGTLACWGDNTSGQPRRRARWFCCHKRAAP
jgi:alpha-tubulin suppressor-like RCC1 family protein